jgi:tRNA G18 (ribose-2'-O)-methylase SpoU
MDERELLIERIMRGDAVNIDDVAQHNFKRELLEINNEAARRLDAETTRREAAKFRENQITELLKLDAAVEQLYLDDEANERRRNEVLQPIAEREIEIRLHLNQKQRKFIQIFHTLNGSTYEFRSVNNPLIGELRSRGAALSKINIPVHEIPYSPSAIMVLEEREKG